MTYSDPAAIRTRPVRIRKIRVAGLLVVVVAIAAALGYDLPGSSSPRTPSPPAPASPTDMPRSEHRRALGEAGGAVARLPGALGEADGAIPAGTTVFDDGVPGVANLDPALLSALRRAATDAAKVGVTFFLDSGWRSPAYQEHLLRDAVAQYGSAEQAAQWVATPNRSAHVSGDAVDIGPADATSWLSAHGAAYGLCQIYGNEPWHYELRPEAAGDGCPSMYADPTRDPRMQQ